MPAASFRGMPRAAQTVAWCLLALACAGARPALARDGAPPPGIDAVEVRLAEARGLLRLGRTADALQRLQQLREQAPDNWRVLQLLGAALESTGKTAEALELFRQAAARLSDPVLPLMELERIYRQTQRWDEALQICLEVQEVLGERGDWVFDEMESLIRTDHVGGTAQRALEEACGKHPEDDRLHELLVIAYFHSGQVPRALKEAGDLDRRRKAKGAVLLRYARLAEDKGNAAAALEGYESVLRADPVDALREESMYRRALALRRLGRPQDGLAAYQELLGAFPSGRYQARARMEMAAVLDREMNRPQEALSAYQEVLSRIRATSPARGSLAEGGGEDLADQVRLAMADCHLRLGRPADAARLYAELADTSQVQEIRGAALYQGGEMLFFQGKLKEAEEAYYKLLDAYPASRYVNDALARILLIGEKSDNGGVPLAALGQAEYQRRVGQTDKGLLLVKDALRQYPGSRAADQLLYEQTRLLLELGRLEEAGVSADTLAARFPESLVSSRALLEVADQFRLRSGGATQAQAIYMQILLRHPDSLEAAQARAALQEMKEHSKDSSWRPDERETSKETGG